MYSLCSRPVSPLCSVSVLRKLMEFVRTMKGYVNIRGYKVVANDKINPGRYGFGIIHDVNKPCAFSRRGCCAPWLDEVANEG